MKKTFSFFCFVNSKENNTFAICKETNRYLETNNRTINCNYMKTSHYPIYIIRCVCIALLACLCYACDNSSSPLFESKEEAPVVSKLAEELGFSQERPLVMGMNTSYAPLQYVDEEGTPCGYDVEFTKVLMKRMGIPFTFSPNIWDKMSPGIIGGKYDMGMMVYSSYRKDVTNYSYAVFRLYYQIVYRKKDYAEFDFRNLKNKRIAYMKSRPIGQMLKKEGAVDYSITDLSGAFVDLLNGKYDGLICYRFQAAYNISKLHLEEQLKTDELSLEPREYCYVSYDKRLIDAINDELKEMEKEGIIDEIYGQEVVSEFGSSIIPLWVWCLLALLTFLFLIIFSVNRYRLSKRLQLAYNQMSEKNDALIIANARAEESTRMKSVFIKQISHEIRTPLNVLSGFAQLITSPVAAQMSESEIKEASQKIMESTSRITGLVNKMLELSEVNSHTILERTDEVSPHQIAEAAIKTTGINHAPHLQFQLELGERANHIFLTHQKSAERILEQLLDNAKKFTQPAESFHATTDAAPQHQESATLSACLTDEGARFVVENTGKPIPTEQAEHIFDEFVQLDEFYDGTGIGLAVARSLARRLGGDIQLDTTFTSGARFILTLPN